MPETLSIARKEFRGFFASPAAYLFLGGFLAVTLFVFFWGEAFFSRNIADIRPLFEWMPVLLIFLVAALTMRSWSEERRAGTLESLVIAPVSPIALVIGKFLATLALVALALLLTWPLPITVNWLGNLDWGPVIGGYVASLFLAAAYIAIGLTMSSRTDNPIVALILTALTCGLFYLIGSDTLTQLFGRGISDLLTALGTGSRFDSITRGVIDLRDLYYYLSLVGVFLTLNLFGLEKLRWAGNATGRHHRRVSWTAGLVAANLVAANLWLAPIHAARADLTDNQRYSLSPATAKQLANLQEPLRIKGYFSSRTHPQLAPLVPQIQDLLKEYAALGGDRVQVEFIDPQQDSAAAEEAASRYGIRPVPFQTASRYQSSVVNSYFDLVIAYGDEYETLNYRDLVEVKSTGANQQLEVVLKNPEYAVTRTIRKVTQTYRAGGDPFAALDKPVTFKGYVSPSAQLPTPLAELRGTLEEVLAELDRQGGDQFDYRFTDPAADGGKLAERLRQQHGLSPQVTGLLDPQPFWFSMMLASGDDRLIVPLPDTLDKASLKRAIEEGLQRLAPGLLKTVTLVEPEGSPRAPSPYRRLKATLREDLRIETDDLTDGRVPEATDLLLVMAPERLGDKQLFAIDQFLMRGGSVILATSPYDVALTRTLTASRQASGLEEWLAHQGIRIGDSMVLDPQSADLPVPVPRNVGGLTVREIRMLPYPHFPDLRGQQLNPDNPITASLDQLTLNWASPITVDAQKNAERRVVELLESSEASWTSDSLDVLPDYQTHPDTGFPVEGERGSHLLAVTLEGRFTSFFQDRESPLLTERTAAEKAAPQRPEDAATEAPSASGEEGATPTVSSVIASSPESARLMVVASNTFASDTALELASQGMGTVYDKPLAFLQNAIDWSLEDRDLLALRGQTRLARTLVPLSPGEQQLIESLNYGLALAGLLVVGLWRRQTRRQDRQRYQRILEEV